MFRNLFKNNSIAKDYLLMFFAVIIAILSLSIWLSFSVYSSKEKIKQETLIRQTNRINQELADSLNYVANFITIVAKNIIQSNPKDLTKIAEILDSPLITNRLISDKFSWAMLDWDDVDGKMLVSSAIGILKKPKDVSYREYVKLARKEPWKLHFDSISIGVSSGELVIPAGMGIADSNNNFIGIISLGFRIDKLVSNLEKIFSNHAISFLILNAKNEIILYSSDINEAMQSQCVKSSIANNVLHHKKFTCGNVVYSYYKKMDKYPFDILSGYNKNIAEANYNEILLPSIVGFIAIGIVSLFMFILMRSFIIKPIIQLSNVADKIIHIGSDEEILLPNTKIKELNILRDQLNNLIHFIRKLKEKEQELRASKAAVEQIVQERTIDLNNALNAKVEFLNNISHEIRTPVHGFTSISEGLLEHWREFDEIKKFNYIQDIAYNANRLKTLVGNLLDMSKFISGKMIMDFSAMNFNKALENIINECEVLYLANKHINISYQVKGKISLVADHERLEQVLRNLFFNAIKFTPDGGAIEALAEINDDNLHFILKDSGIGIPEEELATIFSPFAQSSRTRSKAGGTGLGLGICKKIIDAHHGRIWAENNLPQGARFNFILPLNQGNNTKITVSSNPIVLSHPSNILMIDDDQACLIGAEIQLSGTNLILKSMLGGKAGLSYLKTYPPVDVILLDLMMADMYGLSLLAEIKKDNKLAQIPVILQTGSSDEAELERASSIGVSSIIKKPYDKEELIMKINNALSGQ